MKNLFLFLFILSFNFIIGQTADSWVKFGNKKLEAKDNTGAIMCFNKALELDSNMADAYLLRGLAKSELNDFRGSLSDCNLAINAKFTVLSIGFAYYQRGLAKWRLKDSDGACWDFSKSGELGYSEAYETITEFCNK